MIKNQSVFRKRKSPFQIGLFCLFLLLNGCKGAETPAEVTRSFWDALTKNDISRAKDYATQSSREWVDRDSDLDIQGSALKIGEIRIKDQQASVQTIFTFTEPEIQPDLNINTYLIMENDTWKVDFDKTSRMIPGKAFKDLMQSLEKLAESYKRKLEEQAPLIEEKIESLNEQLIEEINELNQQLEKPVSPEKQPPPTNSI